ncbi:phage tail tape measure protein [Paracoccus sp. 22332]|uniref:phage tail tape measure protein n=1 Tax=Paracoccus sp. 22332 TaxID=3453913 RepID=UPI003F870519
MARTHESRLIVSLLDRVTAPGRRVAGALRGLGGQIDRFSQGGSRLGMRLEAAMARNEASLDRARVGIADTVASYYTLKAAIGAPVQAAREFDSAMADVRKVVDFPTPKAYAEFRQGLIDLSKRVPITINGLADIAAAAGQAGIAGEDLTRFTEKAAQIGTAFDISADEAGSAMAKLMTGLNLTIDEAVLLADAMNHLSNAQASGADEVLDVVRRVGAQGKQFGFTGQEVAAFGSAMISAGAQSEVAATSFMNMGRALTRGESATKRQSAAMSRLGLNSAEVARRMQDDAVGTTIDVMERIAALPKEVQAAVSSDLFGDEARALGPLLTNLDLIRESVAMVADEASYAGSSFKEFQVRSKTFDNAVKIFNNRMHALKVTIGSALIPVLTDMMDAIAPVVEKLTAFVDAHPQLVSNLMLSVGALIAFRGALAGLRFVGLLGQSGALNLAHLALVRIAGTAAGIRGAGVASTALQASLAAMQGATLTRWDRMGAALRGMAGATPGLRLAAPAVGAVVTAIGAISAPVWIAIAAAVAALGAAWKYWDRIAAIADGVGRAISERLRPEMEKIREWAEPLGPILRRFADAWRPISQGIDDAANAVRAFGGRLFSREILTDAEAAEISARAAEITRNIISKLDEIVAGVRAMGADIYEAGAALIQSLWDGMKDRWAKVIAWAGKLREDFRAAVGDGLMGVLSGGRTGQQDLGTYNPETGAFEQIDGARAKGGRVSAGATYLVGEEGPERFTANRSGYIHPTGSGGGLSIGAITINPTLTFPGVTAADADRIAREVMRRLEAEAGAALRGAFADLQVG